ncbi:M14 family metallopeptidase [Alkaliphilus peptidifermentans]|uniref:Zinc carboxypeptidase n=1 Tax=Alkaliphilus peptidifermentans DSM 18978 TaxID=1120976 RepID=A0A1G5ILH6_9FIRM|nr:M14 family metallopeptidase [Alkaliphilus peptidifermentans]SCY76560.1 Zinc carboxypeptidase [Alkaliphilus peptidifermentans DSM 18978]
MNKILVDEGLSWEQKKRAVEVSLINGFYSTSAKFPVISKEEGMKIPESLAELHKKYSVIPEKWPEDYTSAIKEAKSIMEFDWRKKKGLETLFSKGMFLEDDNFDQLPDKLNFKIEIPNDCDLSVLTAACNFAFRFGMETTAYEGPIIAEDSWNGNLLVFEKNNECGMEFIEKDKRKIIRIFGQDQELEKFSADICQCFPLLSDGRTWVEQLKDMTDSLVMKDLDGQLSYLRAYEKELEGVITAYVSPKIEEAINNIQPIFPKVEFKNHKGKKKIYEKIYDIPWEVDVFKDILREKLYHKLKPGDEVEIYGALSEEKDVRSHLTKEVEAELRKVKARTKEIQVICAYKQGFSWIEEVILPQLEGKKVKKMEIAFKPFLPDGVTEWVDEDGATPTYHNLKADCPDKWFDIPIRYLQELYPVDDIIEKKLEINRDNVEFVTYDGEHDITYEVKAFGAKGEILLTSVYKASYSERPYLDDYPQMGKVHPSTGFIKVFVNGIEVVNEYIATDVENIWNIYQAEVLPKCKKFIETKTGGYISVESQPFFSQLRLEVDASEPDYPLPFREDLISSLDSLHEDIHFVGADYFKVYGMESSKNLIDAPGLILPVIKKGIGKPKFMVTLYDEEEKTPCIKANNKLIKSHLKREEVELYLQKLSYADGKITAFLKTNIKEEKIIESYMYLLEHQLLKVSKQFKSIDALKILTEENCYAAGIIEQHVLEKNLSILDIDLMEHTLIGYGEYIEIINQLKHVPGINVYPIATSYLGRDIYAIELLPKEEGYVSRTKRITNLPSQIINSRHHANEVSSTNAAFMLLKKLLTEEKYKSISGKLNLVIVPMENVDGAAIHYELQKDNPKWKLHVARFNAIGKEFYHEHFKSDTIHTEAMALTRLWEKYLPDIIIDNHGVPSHEWEQQFSGYTSPSFKGFWLPRSLLYGYFWIVNDDDYKSNYSVNKKIEEVIADKIQHDDEITQWNKEWMSKFEKYAHGWMPKLFPADYYKNMINYWIPFSFDPSHRYPSIRFPWITTVAYTSEVADETAQGDYLNLCAKAHVAHDEAVIEMLMNCTCAYERKCEIAENKISISCIRHRPIIV